MVTDIDKRTKNNLTLSLGGNLGDVKYTFEKVIKMIEAQIGEIILKSSVYQTEAWGIENQPQFLNQVIQVETHLNPVECLHVTQDIENRLGRTRKGEQWSERIIDIDILFYNNEIIELPDLIVPHTHIQQRNFILIPLVEICPDYIHPNYNKSISTLKSECTDQLIAKKIPLSNH